MDRKKLFKHFALLIVAVFLLNLVALKLYWYYSIWWFDMLMHFSGGFGLGLLFIWFFSYENLSLELSPNLIFKLIFGVLIVGLSWEVYEFFVNEYIARNPFDILDTTSDLFFDLAGGVSTLFYYPKRIMLGEKNKLQ